MRKPSQPVSPSSWQRVITTLLLETCHDAFPIAGAGSGVSCIPYGSDARGGDTPDVSQAAQLAADDVDCREGPLAQDYSWVTSDWSAW